MIGDEGGPSIAKVRIDGARRTFHSHGTEVEALAGVSLDVKPNEFVSIVGPSGCGKSTLLRIIAGLIRPSAGTIEIAHENRDRHLSSVVFQEYSVFPWRSVKANVRLGLDAARVPRKVADARAMDWIKRVGLESFANAYPNTLSGGMKQRVALARAFVMEPELLLMDEPFAALDVQLRKLLQEELLAIYESTRNTVIFVTHSIEEAILLSDRIVVMSARPGTIRREVIVPFERPRSPKLRGEPEFAALEEMIWQELRGEVVVASQAMSS